jgi:hypothetical protein
VGVHIHSPIHHGVALSQAQDCGGPRVANLSTLKMKGICSSETSVHVQTAQSCIPQDVNIHKYRCENLKSCSVKIVCCSHVTSCSLVDGYKTPEMLVPPFCCSVLMFGGVCTKRNGVTCRLDTSQGSRQSTSGYPV